MAPQGGWQRTPPYGDERKALTARCRICQGNVLAAGSTDGTAWMWLAETGECMQVFAGHEGGVTCGTFSGTGKVRWGQRASSRWGE